MSGFYEQGGTKLNPDVGKVCIRAFKHSGVNQFQQGLGKDVVEITGKVHFQESQYKRQKTGRNTNKGDRIRLESMQFKHDNQRTINIGGVKQAGK